MLRKITGYNLNNHMKIAIDINDVIRDNMHKFKDVYIKNIDPDFELNDEDITSFNQLECYPFASEEELYKFKYVDYPFELYARAECCDKMLPYVVNDWTEKTLMDLDEECVPEIMFFSPFEIGLTIQSTFTFLSGKSLRPREVWFPKDSIKIYEKADIVITAQPSLIEGCPEGKTVIKINTPYNKEIETKYSFDSLLDVIADPNQTLIKILENKE